MSFGVHAIDGEVIGGVANHDDCTIQGLKFALGARDGHEVTQPEAYFEERMAEREAALAEERKKAETRPRGTAEERGTVEEQKARRKAEWTQARAVINLSPILSTPPFQPPLHPSLFQPLSSHLSLPTSLFTPLSSHLSLYTSLSTPLSPHLSLPHRLSSQAATIVQSLWRTAEKGGKVCYKCNGPIATITGKGRRPTWYNAGYCSNDCFSS